MTTKTKSTEMPNYTKGLKILDADELNDMIAEFQSELDWKQQENDELYEKLEDLNSKHSTLQIHYDKILGEETLGDKLSMALREIRDDVKAMSKDKAEQDIKIASLEQSRATARKAGTLLGVPILGAILHTFLKSIGLY